MRCAAEVTLKPTTTDRLRSKVIISNQPTETVISGCVLEAAIKCEQGWLLFVTDDVPAEDMLSIYLLNPSGTLRDWARLGGAYTTGTFSGLRLEPPNAVRFRFIDQADWYVEVLTRPSFAIPWLPDVKGVSRGSNIKRHFVVKRY